ncbi:MAG: 16S rRNA (cytosine(1402)-N(4))-methyltransferase RsmH [Gammaproteobacteria bacterium]
MLPDEHRPVMPEEAIRALAVKRGERYIDCTFGRGGHSRLILQRLDASGNLLAFDRDDQAIHSQAALDLGREPNFELQKSTIGALAAMAATRDWTGKVAGILMDLGLSSPQLDDRGRGFSFLKDGPLDMRMDPSSGITAAQWLETVSERRLSEVLKTFGEERYSRLIAKAIVAARATNPIRSTLQLARLIENAVPTRDPKKHPATRSFQAIRILLNRELEELQEGLEQALAVLKPGGRLVVISFHSLEDRIVKRFIRRESRGGDFPAGLPVEASAYRPRLQAVGHALRPDQAEIDANPRARSAIMRTAERLA